MNLIILEDSKNYTAQVIKLPAKQLVSGLDNLVKVNYQGNDCLVGKDSNPDELYLFFPAESQLSHEFLSFNNLYRHEHLNSDKTKKGFFEDNRRVKALKFKGVISSGFIIPLSSISYLANRNNSMLVPGVEFNSLNGVEICRKYVKKVYIPGQKNQPSRLIDRLVDSKMAPEHMDTSHLLKNVDRFSVDDYVAITYKLHGTSARYYNTLVKRKLSLLERIASKLGVKVQTDEYRFISASRRVIKSVDFEELDNKQHYYCEDLWTKVGKEFFDGKLNRGEAVYCEIIGKDYQGQAIQHGYTYGLEKPKVYIYRISNINSQGIEIDLPYQQMKERAVQLGVNYCPELFYGKLNTFLNNNGGSLGQTLEEAFNDVFYNNLLEKPSILDSTAIEEGFCIRIDKYTKPDIYKIKSKLFLLHEGALKDKEIVDLEEQNA